MNKRDYGFYEDYILNKHTRAIDMVKTNLDSLKKEQPQEVKPQESSFVSQYGDNPFVGLSGSNDFSNSQGMGAQERQLSRIRTMDSGVTLKPVVQEPVKPQESFGYGNVLSFDDISYVNSNKGASFVLVLAAVIALVIIVAVVSFSIINKIGL